MEPRITGSRFVLAVIDLERSGRFYKEKLGFQTLWEGGGWHFLYRENIQIMIGECPGVIPAFQLGDHSYFGYFDVVNIDDLHEEYKSNGVEILSEVEDKEWGQREFSVRTADGHRITLGEAISALT